MHLTRIGRFCGLRAFSRGLASAAPLRGSFAELSNGDVQAFKRILGASGVQVDELEAYNNDFMGWYKGKSRCVLFPKSAEEVSALLRHCYERRLAVVPQSGNTGLVGGSTPVFDEVVLSLRRLKTHYELDPSLGVLECDAGFILEELEQRLAPAGFIMPLDLGAKGSCLVGGTVNTCAGGIRLLRYGSLHASILGLDVVLPDAAGTILRLGSGLRKDNTALHSHHLFIGSEGQLGVTTRVRVLVAPKPASVHSAMLSVPSFEAVVGVLRLARSQLTEILSSFEFLDPASLTCLKDNLGIDRVFPGSPDNFNVLVETSGSNADHDTEKFSAFLESCLEAGLAEDGVLAANASEAAKLWNIREGAPLSLFRDGYVYKFDVSLPLVHFDEATAVLRERLGDRVKRIINFGHVGDGNVHVNVTASEYSQEVYDLLHPFFYEWVTGHGGSISAEHGIGRLKRAYAHLGHSQAEHDLHRRLKAVFDPRGILSPYKMLDALV